MASLIENSSKNPLQGCANNLGPGSGAERLRSFDGCSDGAVDDELGQYTEGAGDTEENGVVVLFRETEKEHSN